MKILITGGSGLFGSNLLLYLQNKGDILYYTIKSHVVQFDGTPIIGDLTTDISCIDSNTYDIIINTVALTDVDACEKNPGISYRLNTEIPEKLAKYCLKTSCHLIHISTDQIFDGKEGNYTEESRPNPINVYAKTKYEAEQRIQNILPQSQYTIIRTNFFGINCLDKFSFSEWILDCLKNKKEIKMYIDVFFNPLLVNTLSEIIYKCIQYKLAGIYNCTSDKSISKYDFGMMVKETFHLDHKIQKISINDMKLRTIRPKNMTLLNSKIKNIPKIGSLSIEDEIRKLYSLYQNNYPGKLKAHYVS